MPGWVGFDDIAPVGEGQEREPFSLWFARVEHRIPNIPRNVAEHWLHRHWGDSPYYGMPLEQLRFRQEGWSNDKFIEIETGPQWSFGKRVEAYLHDPSYRPRQTDMLWETMSRHGTWPQPIIVLDNPTGFAGPMATTIRSRWLLVEGHLRATYLHYLITDGRAQPTHQVWVCSMNA